MEQGTHWDWGVISNEIGQQDWEDNGDGTESRRLYLGTVTHNSPSGRRYAPWSSVEEELRETDADWWESQEEGAAGVDLSFETGEGDGNDLYAIEYRDGPEREFEVTVVRRGIRLGTIIVAADNYSDAVHIARDRSDDIEFGDEDDYEIDWDDAVAEEIS